MNTLFNFVSYVWVTLLCIIWIFFLCSWIFILYKIYKFKKILKWENEILKKEIKDIQNIHDLEQLKEIEKKVDQELEEYLKKELKK